VTDAVVTDAVETDAVLQVVGLTVRFGGVIAVDDVNFTVERGTVIGLVGPNGAGKTTVFDAICGLVPSRGRVILDGQDISERPTAARARAGLGRSYQDARLFPSLTVREAMAMAFERHVRTEGVVSTMIGAPWVRRSERRVAQRVDELIELMGLTAFRDKFVSELSTGSRRIVDLAMSLAHDPLVLLLDEPSSGIAQRETEALGPLLLRVRDETGATLLVVEHDMPLITSISDELLALETGHVVTRGAPAEVLDDPRLVSAYLGTDRAVVERSGTRAKEAPAKKAAKRAKKARG
jgi:ABC-type branched-subunit amino acid transport system ATPase component